MRCDNFMKKNRMKNAYYQWRWSWLTFLKEYYDLETKPLRDYQPWDFDVESDLRRTVCPKWAHNQPTSQKLLNELEKCIRSIFATFCWVEWSETKIFTNRHDYVKMRILTMISYFVEFVNDGRSFDFEKLEIRIEFSW